jgi:uncharacterized integral membrane protein
MTTTQTLEPMVYQGQFGAFTIDATDRQGVLIYRTGLAISALSFAIGVGLLVWLGNTSMVLKAITLLFAVFSLGLGISLFTIHIYLEVLHRALQVFWGIGVISAIAIATQGSLALMIYEHPLLLLGIGFIFAALTGIFFKEAFCFNRLETKFLTLLVPGLLLGHLLVGWPIELAKVLLVAWASLYVIFAARKAFQAIPDDIGDKSVFDHLHQQRAAKAKA